MSDDNSDSGAEPGKNTVKNGETDKNDNKEPLAKRLASLRRSEQQNRKDEGEWHLLVVDPPEIREEIFDLWLTGNSDVDAAKLLFETPSDSEIQDPDALGMNFLFHVDDSLFKILLNNYYDFDATVMREFIAYQLNWKIRKELEDVSERTGVPIASCGRQFNNFKRILLEVNECGSEEPAANIIQDHFRLSSKLSAKYAQICFLCDNRIELGRKKLDFISLPLLMEVSQVMLDDWTNPKGTFDISWDISESLQQLKLETDKKRFMNHYKKSFFRQISQKISFKGLLDAIDSDFNHIIQNLVFIGTRLSIKREFRNFFSEIVDRLCTIFKQIDLSPSLIGPFFELLSKSFDDLNLKGLDASTWHSYLNSMSKCLSVVYREYIDYNTV